MTPALLLAVRTVLVTGAMLVASLFAVAAETNSLPGDRMLAEYFRAETATLAGRCLTEFKTLTDWIPHRERSLQQLQEMLGLWPMPDRTDLKAVVTGKAEYDQFIVEKIHFQSLPGLYVTANFYLPRNPKSPVPAILYVCGHGSTIKQGVSFGNKVTYQHHGAWFAQNGYACLIIDTLQLGEIQGIHHGTYREGMWWWNSRGYTPAGVEAWNSIRALDYLSTRPEVDTNRFGITGRSGGGAYSWTTAALDDRIKVAAPVAGITDLQNYVVDGAIEGHCDCMFLVNTYRWDYPQLAAMIAPRPLLIANTDRDSIFPLDGVERLHEKVRHIYHLHGAATNLGLLITEGPHLDSQDLQLPVLRWFNRFLKGEDPLIEPAARKQFEPEQLRVFVTLPADQVNTAIQESFVPAATEPPVPASPEQWTELRDSWLAALREKSFAAWPSDSLPLDVKKLSSTERNGVRLQTFSFTSQQHVSLPLYLVHAASSESPRRVVLQIPGESQWKEWSSHVAGVFPDALTAEQSIPSRRGGIAPPDTGSSAVNEAWLEALRTRLASNHWTIAVFPPRGVGPNAWSGDAKRQTHLRRRFMLLGQTLDGMRVWDIRRAIQTIRLIEAPKKTPLWLEARQDMAVNALYASLYEPGIAGLELNQLPNSHRPGPDYLNVLRILDVPQALAIAMERSPVHVLDSGATGWEYPDAIRRSLEWDKKGPGY